jgi:dolichol kinase
MLVIMNLGKQAISFGMGFGVLDWVMQSGYNVIIAGVFTAVLCVDTFAALTFYFFGKNIRKATSVGRLARMHQRSIIDPGLTH